MIFDESNGLRARKTSYGGRAPGYIHPTDTGSGHADRQPAEEHLASCPDPGCQMPGMPA